MLEVKDTNLKTDQTTLSISSPDKRLIKNYHRLSKLSKERTKLYDKSIKLHSILIHDKVLEKVRDYHFNIYTEQKTLQIFEAFCQTSINEYSCHENYDQIYRASLKIAADLCQTKNNLFFKEKYFCSRQMERKILEKLQWNLNFPSFLQIGDFFTQWIHNAKINFPNKLLKYHYFYQQQSKKIIFDYEFFFEYPQKLAQKVFHRTFEKLGYSLPSNISDYFWQNINQSFPLIATLKQSYKLSPFYGQICHQNQSKCHKLDLKTLREKLIKNEEQPEKDKKFKCFFASKQLFCSKKSQKTFFLKV